MKKLHLIFAAVGLLVLSLGITGCDPKDPNNPDNPNMPAIVSTSETNSDGIIVEVVYKNDLRMYFKLTSPNTCGLTTFAPFYGVRGGVISNNDSVGKSNVSQGFEQYAYSGDLIIPETITHKGVVYTVTDIFSSVREYSDDVTSVWIPKTIVEDIIWDLRLENLTAINVATDNPNYVSEEGVLFNKTKTTLLTYPEAKPGAYTIPDGVTEIGNAFMFCKALTSLTISNSITTIGADAFYSSSLTSVTIPNSVTTIGADAFKGCSSLTSITIPSSITKIGEGVFAWCDSLTSITIPNSVTEIGSGAFDGCESLKFLAIPNSVTEIGIGAFSNCTSLESITLSNNVTKLEKYLFSNCSSLSSLTIPSSVTKIMLWVFDGCSSLTTLTCLALSPPYITQTDSYFINPQENSFTGSSIQTVRVPAASVSSYKYYSNWGRFNIIAL